MAVATNPRAGRTSALLAGFQSAKGTPVANFSSAAILRMPGVEVDLVPATSDPAWMSSGGVGQAAAETEIPLASRGVLVAQVTPETIETVLRGHWGTFAGGVFALGTQVSEWITLAFLEDATAANARKVVRLYDAWFPRARLDILSSGRAQWVVEYVAEADDVRAGNALAGLTLPAALPALPIVPTNVNELAGRTAVLKRDPLDANETVPFDRLSILFEATQVERWYMSNQRSVAFKAGHERVSIEVEGRVGDEAWTVIEKARAGTRQGYRLTLSASNPAKTFTVDMNSVRFEHSPLAVDQALYRPFSAIGRALKDSSGNFVTLQLA